MTIKLTIIIEIIVSFFFSMTLLAVENLLPSQNGQLELLSKAKVSEINYQSRSGRIQTAYRYGLSCPSYGEGLF
jgi:hypothetical protein